LTKQFISEPLRPLSESFDAGAMVHGEPGLPHAFEWRGETLEIKTVLKVWRSTKEDRGDHYLARHWYEIETPDGRRCTIYFDRHAKSGKPRWWLYTLSS